MSYSISDLFETKAFGTLSKKKIDLRALEARAYAIVNARGYPDLVKQQSSIALKKLDAVKRKLRTALVREVQAWKRGEISYNALISKSRAFIDTTYREAFIQGLKAQGHGALRGRRGTRLSPTDTLTREDSEWISSAVAEEMTYWTRFMKTMISDYEEVEKVVYNPKKKQWDTEVEQVRRKTLTKQQQKRLDMYIATVDSVYDSGKVQGAPDWVIIDWVLGEAEHCPECLLLAKHSPYTKQTLPCTPRSGCTRCLSNCKCHLLLTRVDEKVYSSLNKRIKSAAPLLKKLERSRKLSRGLPEVASMLVREEVKDHVAKNKRVLGRTGNVRRPNRSR